MLFDKLIPNYPLSPRFTIVIMICIDSTWRQLYPDTFLLVRPDRMTIALIISRYGLCHELNAWTSGRMAVIPHGMYQYMVASWLGNDLVLCDENPPVNHWFPSQGPAMGSFGVPFYVGMIKLLKKTVELLRFETPRRPCDATVVCYYFTQHTDYH